MTFPPAAFKGLSKAELELTWKDPVTYYYWWKTGVKEELLVIERDG